jgi:eukaryotic-like serine/threonine-protein kinase
VNTPNRPVRLGKYVLLERLAAGGMGEVFLARAGAKGFERFFAVKRILGQHAESPEFVQLLMNEARISVKLVHANIAQVFEFGQVDQSFFMAMEYVEGLSLNAIIRRARESRVPIRTADAVWIALQVCRALHYAHTRHDDAGRSLDIIHRDISPHNILVDESGSVKLIDFGIAKASQGQVQTEASTIKGKIPYMSPEQASGGHLDPRSDLYALGIVLYECLTMERMYPSGNTFETFALVRHGKLPDIDARLRGKIPDELLFVLHQALQKERDARYATAAEMESDLQRILSALDPGYTSYALADLVRALDVERDERKARLQQLAALEVDEISVDTSMPTVAPGAGSSPKVLAAPSEPPPLPVDLTLGSFLKTASSKPDLTPASVPGVASTREPSQISVVTGIVPQKSYAPLIAAALGGAVIVLAAVVIFGRQPPPTPVPADPTPPVTTPTPTPTPVVVPIATPDAGPSVVATPTPTPTPTPVSTPPKKTKRDKKAGSSKELACVSVNAVPWAHVSENGKRLGTTPLPCLELSVGTHTLVLENPVAGAQKSVKVKVTADGAAKVFERF